MGTLNTIRRGLLRFGLAATSLLAGAAGAQGITDTAVKIGVSGALTGPVAAVGAVVEGIRVRVAAVNAAGGVKMGDGKTRSIELVVQDDALDPQRTMTNVRKLVEQSGVFALAGIAGTPNNQAIGRYLDQRKVPNLFMYSGVHELADGRAWLIGLVPSFTTEAAVFADYLKKNKPDAKLALLYVNTETGQTFQAGLRTAIQGSKLQIVAAQAVTSADPTIDTQLSTLKASGADTLVVVAAPKQSAQAVRFAAESGWRPVTMLSYIGASPSSLKPAGLANAKGVITSAFAKPVTAASTDPAVRQYLADHAAAKARFDTGDSMGQIGYITGEALIRTLEAVKQPTRQALIDAAQNMNQVGVGLLLPGVTLTTKRDSGDIYPIESLQLFRFDGEQYQALGGLVSFEGRTPRH
ncbi:ABC transporter substrate-binding protein [Pseudoduganella namucuonensis]|uniref:Amino acid/amide ABC transporter substrate-binding protein, HAAT family n=1 Tax=Pseudoduganella namucuonensis TaxID=1035707 RepID=A0A1I7LPJ3_9BURK|nr:ABC transporter substrate-binding protein [Pseudoduganella namucuonensis]SFV11554.1 amino acid/amide ABC transporter substrate-binding protein, HAAT family [Pseudoduganella namucuonensis]